MTPDLAAPKIPAHVPPELVKFWDFHTPPGLHETRGGNPWREIAKLHEGAQKIFYMPADPRSAFSVGAWVPLKAEDIRRVLQDAETFSGKSISGFSRIIGESWDMLPLEVDPPAHTAYRALLNPLFAPKKMAAMEEDIRASAVNLINDFAGETRVEFMEAFGRPFPVQIFMRLMGLPLEETAQFLQWENDILHVNDMAVRKNAMKSVARYLQELADARRKKPVDDIVSFIVSAQVEGRKLNDQEVLGMCFLLFVGGLDTVASSLGWHFRFLASNSDAQNALRGDPALIPNAVEEFLRAYSVVHMSRKATRDVELAGAPIKAGDRIVCATMIADLDPSEWSDPEEVQIQRDVRHHMAFSSGVHRCLGSHLARRELVIAQQEFAKRIPSYRLAEPPLVYGGTVFGVKELMLRWD